jgi:hypothetical protein
VSGKIEEIEELGRTMTELESLMEEFPMVQIPVLALDASLAESEFLKRELNLELFATSALDLIHTVKLKSSLGFRSIVVLSTHVDYKHVLQGCPNDSLILFLLGDEAYCPKFRKAVCLAPSVSVVFRNYPIKASSIWATTIVIVRTGREAIGQRENLMEFIKILFIGLRSRRRMFAWRRFKKRVIIVPLGYTSKFAKAYDEVVEAERSNSSLFCRDAQDQNRDISISFRGYLGQIQRRIIVNKALNIPNHDVKVTRNGWSGHSNSDLDGIGYVRMLMRSKLSLCPPGYSNGESFRYYESLICGAIPIEEDVTISHQARLPFRPRDKSESVGNRLDLVREALRHIRIQLDAVMRNA